jgi:hypothetical protein
MYDVVIDNKLFVSLILYSELGPTKDNTEQHSLICVLFRLMGSGKSNSSCELYEPLYVLVAYLEFSTTIKLSLSVYRESGSKYSIYIL